MRKIPKGLFSWRPAFGAWKSTIKTRVPQQIPSTQEIVEEWNEFTDFYAKRIETSLSPASLTLLNMLKLSEASSVLEAACGTGNLLPMILHLKKGECKYFLTDISKEMLSMAKSRIENFEKNPFTQYSSRMKSMTEDRVAFPSLNIHLGLENNEELSEFIKERKFDVYVSNLSLHLVENPERMLKEAYSVLKAGGKLGVSVWGRKENSTFFTLVPLVLKEFGVKLPNKRTYFHLSEKRDLVQLLQTNRFQNILAWYQWIPYDFTKAEEIDEIWNVPFYKSLVKEVAPETLEKIKAAVRVRFKSHLESRNEPLGLEILFAIGEKL